MRAEVEMMDGSYSKVEMEPVCGEDFCDGCGDCLACQAHDDESWCRGGSHWVIYRSDKRWEEAQGRLIAQAAEV